MCGIVGILGGGNDHVIGQMLADLRHRGPDGDGVWSDPKESIFLGHTRLAVLDLTSQGDQPMRSSCGRYIVVFNGEIYNHLEIRKEIKSSIGYSEWLGHSDTETILVAISYWGLEEAVKKFVGMFALALWDSGDRRLYLVRDRLGEKPLYYGWVDNSIVFASELKPLKRYSGWTQQINREVLPLYLKCGYIPAPFSIYSGIYKLMPGTILSLHVGADRDCLKPTAYWSMKDAALEGIGKPFSGDEGEAIDHLEGLIDNSVRGQMLADVPLGAFLSGGIDSSTIVALMQAQSSDPVKTFTIGFNEQGFNEADDAKLIAQYLKTDHTELYVEPHDALSVIPKLPEIYDEPFADPSQIPTYLVSHLAKQHVTVSLSGDGGDELFGGYPRYLLANRVWNNLQKIPKPMRQIISRLIMRFPQNNWDRLLSFFQKDDGDLNGNISGQRLHRFANMANANSSSEMYSRLLSQWINPEQLILGSNQFQTLKSLCPLGAEMKNFIDQMMYEDSINYLPDDILVKVDRAAMAVSLETRVPFLDHRIVEFAWRLPREMKVRNSQGKWILRKVLSRHIPDHFLSKNKKGFSIPLAEWLRGPLRDWAESLLNESKLDSEGYFISEQIRKKWLEHLSGKCDHHAQLWSVLMFEAWLSKNK